MKICTHYYRVSLLIGLLSLSTLSACVNTKQKLGWWPCPSGGDVKRYFNRHPGIDLACKWTARVVCIGSTVIGGVWVIRELVEHGQNQHYKDQLRSAHDAYVNMMNRMSCLSIDTPFRSTVGNTSTPLYSTTPLPLSPNMTIGQAELITKMIKNGNEKWNNGSTT